MTADWLLAGLRHDRAVVLGSLTAATILDPSLILGAGVDGEMMDMGGGQMMAMAPEWTLGYGIVFFLMWSVMMVAMMLPSAAPITLLVAGIAKRRRQQGGDPGFRTAPFVLGYLAVWILFAAAATLLQWQLDLAEQLSETMAVASMSVAGTVLIAAGIYEWTPLKQTCLRHCRMPISFLMSQWKDSVVGAFTSGLRHGVFCLGCCWVLMALLFVGGIMNLAWIAAIALLVLIEKALPWGGRMGRIAGVVLVVWGAVTLAMVP